MIEGLVLFALAVAIAAAAMSSGIAGSNFWTPVFVFYLHMPVQECFWAAQLVMLAGFGSGLCRNISDRTIDWATVAMVTRWAVPAAAVGALISCRLPSQVLLLLFATFALVRGVTMVFRGASWMAMPMGPTTACLAGGLKGLIATGTGAVLLPSMLAQRPASEGAPNLKAPAEVAGTVVVVVFACTASSLLFRMVQDGLTTQTPARFLPLLAYVLPGVVLGGQLGPRIAQRLSMHAMQQYVGVLLVFVALSVMVKALGHS